MIKIKLQKKIFLLACALMPMFANATTPVWQIVPNESKLTFTATQNGAPVTGEFKKFTADIHFDLDHLDTNNIKVVIDTNSISDPYDQLADTLKSSDWFDVKKYPQAVFVSNNFKKIGDKTFVSNGNLTIRDKTLPVILQFTQEEYTGTQARIKGSTTIKRTAFGVGQGDWADTKTIKDEVKIDFAVTANKK